MHFCSWIQPYQMNPTKWWQLEHYKYKLAYTNQSIMIMTIYLKGKSLKQVESQSCAYQISLHSVSIQVWQNYPATLNVIYPLFPVN